MKDWLRTFGKPVPITSVNTTGYAISTSQESLVVSILSAGTFFGWYTISRVFFLIWVINILQGALAGAPIADRLGRKRGIIAACLVFSIGVAMQTAATRIPLFVVGRVFAGLGVGIVSVLVPMYQSEWCVSCTPSKIVNSNTSFSSPKWIRGAVVSLYQWAITIGLLVAAIVNNGTHNINSHAAYRIPIALQFVWASILVLGMTALPEVCPYFDLVHFNSLMCFCSLPVG
jgi:SP family sugar:H+ symporter-like MFS transporter